jgi:hypothetical protein
MPVSHLEGRFPSIYSVAKGRGLVVSDNDGLCAAKRPPSRAARNFCCTVFDVLVLASASSLRLLLRPRLTRVCQSFPHRVKRGLGSAGEVQFRENAADVRTNGWLAGHDPAGDVLIAQPPGN